MKIGVINSHAAQVAAIQHTLERSPQHHITWLAQTAEEGIRLCQDQRPDLILLDLNAPAMGGVEATRQIMAKTPCAILIMTTNVGTMANRVFEAMGHGAMDAIDAPIPGNDDLPHREAHLLLKVDAIHRRLADGKKPVPMDKPAPIRSQVPAQFLVVIGASAGGPAAIRTVLQGLPRNFPAAIVLVQHMDARFAQGMVDWLADSTSLTVRRCAEGDVPTPGVVLIAGTDDHLVFKSAQRLGYSPEPVDCAYRPSVDVFFASVKQYWRQRVVGVVLTGMGKDGAIGLKTLRGQGHHTIVQDKESCVVYGMPKAAIEGGAAVEILPLDQIAAGLIKSVSIEM